MAKKTNAERAREILEAAGELDVGVYRALIRTCRSRMAELMPPKVGVVSLKMFDDELALVIPRYESPLYLAPSARRMAEEALSRCVPGTLELRCYALWLAKQVWYLPDPTQRRALMALGGNIVRAVREYRGQVLEHEAQFNPEKVYVK
ncbi:MAG: hypothetical protein IPL79_19985 [Myxococcales bacterium]|nr:hypothetical protein [Myxococcales bacterium]